MPNLRRRYQPLTAAIALLGASFANAMDYGIFDARALAMGGTVVAVGDTSQAQYYNPALLSFHDGDEDKTRDGRVYFPTIVAQVANTVESAIEAVDDNLDTELSDAVGAFNNQPNTTTAGLVAASAHDLRKVLDKIAGKDLSVDAFVGLSVSEPSDHEGGAFYVGARAIGVGNATITSEDLALLDEYISAMDQIAAGESPAAVAAQHPNLIDENGRVRDPTDNLTSASDVSALAIGEWGMSFAKEFTFGGQAISFGITPKMMRVDVYRDEVDFNNNSFDDVDDGVDAFSDSKTTHMTLNADFGIAAIIADHYRVSIAMKDAFAKEFKTHQPDDPVTGLPSPDLLVKLHSRSRLGLGYVNDSFSVGFDYDLKENEPMANEAPSQNMSFGAEYKPFNTLALRLGYRQDKTGIRDDVVSGGIGFRWRRLVTDFSYAQSSDIKAGSLQVGWTF